MNRNRFVRAGMLAIALGFASNHVLPEWATVHAQAPVRVNVLIGFRNTPGPAEEAVVRAVGGTISHRYRIVPAIAASVPEQAIAGLQRNPFVTVVEPDGLFYAIDAELDNTWGVKRIGAGDAAVHGTGIIGSGIKVAVIDSGVDFSHPDLASPDGNLRVRRGWDYVNNDNDPYDDNGHGTHVAGTIAGADNDEGVIGVAPGVELWAYKVLGASGSGSFSNIIAAIDQAVQDGIRVTNNSYGSGSDPGTLVKAAFDNSAAAGILHIAAAGNSGNPAGKGNNVGYPAGYESVVAVAATTSSDTRASFSSTGSAVEIAAPGTSIPSTVPGGGYESWNGTSMASPHVTGVAALVLGKNTSLTGSQVRTILRTTALDLGTAGRDVFYGYGLVNAPAAVGAADGGTTTPPPDEGGGGTGGTLSTTQATYSWSGGPAGNRHLTVRVQVVDQNATPFAGAAVSINLMRDTFPYWSGMATTGSTGVAVFEAKNIPSGCYDAVVTQVTTTGYSWDNEQPSDAGTICKP